MRFKLFEEFNVSEREVSKKERETLAKKGEAMRDGSFPIKSKEDLKNAIRAHGRAKDPEAAKRFIKKRAREMDLTNLIPKDWTSESLNESFWAATDEYKDGDDNGTTYLSVPGVPGTNVHTTKFLDPIEATIFDPKQKKVDGDSEEEEGTITEDSVKVALEAFKEISRNYNKKPDPESEDKKVDEDEEYKKLEKDLEKDDKWWLNRLHTQAGHDDYQFEAAAFLVWWLKKNVGKKVKEKFTY